MLDNFLNFYSKYPWVAIVIGVHWGATAFIVILSEKADTALILGLAFVATIIYAHFGFKIAKG